MKCPLLHHKEHNPDVFPGETFEDCLKEDCQWWLQEVQDCDPTGLKSVLNLIEESLSNIAKNMPVWKQL